MNAKSKFAVCRHIKTNGRVCQSPALTGGALCYFHRNLRHTHRRPAEVVPLFSEWQENEIQIGDGTGEDYLVAQSVYPHQDEIRFPPLEDAESVQLATSMLFQAVATGQIQFKRARLLIATLKIACINQRALVSSRAAETDPATIPCRIVHTTQGDALLAPEEGGPDCAGPVAGIEPAVLAELPSSEPSSPEPSSPDLSSPEPSSPEPSSPEPSSPEPSSSEPSSPNLPSLNLSSPELEIHPSSTPQPPANPNGNRDLAITHLDAGFCRRPHPANT